MVTLEKMNKGEYWILDSVLTARYPFECLAADDTESVYNKRGHGLKGIELLDTLYRLFLNRDLLAERMERVGTHFVPSDTFAPTRLEIEAALVGTLKAYYGLTPQGGTRWEAVSKPDWNRYVYAGTSLDEGETIASDRKLVEQYEYFSRYTSNMSIIAGSEEWDVLEPWQATYWKTLPIGHRLRYRFTYGDEPVVVPIPPLAKQFFVNIYNWYTKFEE